jgi:hypothetical protein
MELALTHVASGRVQTARFEGGIHIHKAGCRDLWNPRRYREGPEPVNKAGATGEDLVCEWFDNGILDEAVADQLHTDGGNENEVRADIMHQYLTGEFTVMPCAEKLFSQP